jgi:uncharacterized protein (DUF736 family)
MNHPEINQFKEEDNTLIVNIHEANSQIRQLNNADSKRSPNFRILYILRLTVGNNYWNQTNWITRQYKSFTDIS